MGQRRSWGFGYILSFFIPIVGLFMGVGLYMRDDEYDRKAGGVCLACGVAGALAWTYLFRYISYLSLNGLL